MMKEVNNMQTAMDELTNKLLLAGMDQNDIDHLLARFLEEEAYDYVEYMKMMLEALGSRAKSKQLLN